MPANQITVIKREDWGARKPKEDIPPFNFPGKLVVLTLKTDFGECQTKEECIERCQSIQNQHMDQWGLPDIAYNFMIGNDGNVYEGRGWDFRPQKAINNPDHSPQTYDIALIGDYRDEIPDELYTKALNLLNYGSQFALITHDFDYVGCDYDVDPNSGEKQPVSGDDTQPEIFVIE